MVLLPIGSIVVPFWGSYLGSYKVFQKGTTLEPMGMGFYVVFFGLFGVEFRQLTLNATRPKVRDLSRSEKAQGA